MDFNLLIQNKRERFAELEREIADPALFGNRRRAGEVMREHSGIKQLLQKWDQLEGARKQLDDNRELASSRDVEIAAMADDEIPALEKRVGELECEVEIALLPPDENENRDAIVEIRGGTGGSEAAIFAADLYRMYNRYAEASGLKVEDLDSSPSELGGLKEVIFKVSGEAVFRKLRYESGVHRVQRVPATEAQGRIHTSTATVAVLPEAEDVDLEIKPEDLRIEVSRAGGPGGQGVNTTDSAVQVLHIPTGTIVRCQDGRSQIKNKERALSILRARLLERKQREEQEKYSAQRRGQIGTGGREEKIRTYNFPQNRVTDHRIGLTLYNLDRVIDGDLNELISTLQGADLAERLKEIQSTGLKGDTFLRAALDEARQGLAEGGIPIGSVLVCDGKIIGRGHNQRVQKGSVIHHGEMNCLENAGRQKAAVYARCAIYTTLSPCPMCTGAILLYRIPRVVIGENVTFRGAEDLLRANGVTVDVLNEPECIELMRKFIATSPELWNEDIGV